MNAMSKWKARAVFWVIGLLAVISGLYTGSVLAHPGTDWWYAQKGWYIYGASHSSDGSLGTAAHSYDFDHFAWADEAYPDTTRFIIEDFHAFNGTADNDRVHFGLAQVTDGNKSEDYWLGHWYCTDIAGVDNTWDLDPLWVSDNFGTNNVSWKQWMYESGEAQDHCAIDSSYAHEHAWLVY